METNEEIQREIGLLKHTIERLNAMILANPGRVHDLREHRTICRIWIDNLEQVDPSEADDRKRSRALATAKTYREKANQFMVDTVTKKN